MNNVFEKLMDAKRAEDIARKIRINAEVAVEKYVRSMRELPLEGAVTEEIGPYKVMVKCALTRKLDYDAYDAESFPPSIRFVDMKPSINVKRLKVAEAEFPNLVAMCVTEKPAKTAVKVSYVKGTEGA